MSAIELGNITLEDTRYFHFNTHQSNGNPITLSGTPSLEIYEDGNDTPITAGITLDVDTGATPRTGLHEVAIACTAANGFEAGKEYSVSMAAGTVGAVSVVGVVVAHFSCQKQYNDVNTTKWNGTATTGDGDWAELQTDVDAVDAKTTNLPADPASETNVNANETKIDAIQSDVTAIGAKTTNLPADPASETNVNANETKIDSVQADTTAIKAQTDKVNFDSADNVKSSMEAILDTDLSESSAGRIAGNVNTFFDNADAATTKVVDNVGGEAVNPLLAYPEGAIYADDTNGVDGVVLGINGTSDNHSRFGYQVRPLAYALGTRKIHVGIGGYAVSGGSGNKHEHMDITALDSGSVLTLQSGTAFSFTKISSLEVATDDVNGMTGSNNALFEDCKLVDGYYDFGGSVTFKRCTLTNGNSGINVDGQVVMQNTLSTGDEYLSLVASATSSQFEIVGHKGNLILESATNVTTHNIHMMGGTIDIAATCTAGTVKLTGWGRLLNNTGGTVVDDDVWQEMPVSTEANVIEWSGTAVTGDGDWAELQTDVDNILVDTGTTLPAQMTSEHGAINTNVNDNETKIDSVQADTTAIKAKTDNLPADPASETNVDANETKIDAVQATVDVIDQNTENIGASPSGAINFKITDDNTAGVIVGGVTFVGTQTGDKDNLVSDDTLYHQITHDTGDMDIVYKANVGSANGGTSVFMKGYITGTSDTIIMEAWNGSTWDQLTFFESGSLAKDFQKAIPILQEHTGTGGSAGDVFIRLRTETTQTNPILFLNQFLISAIKISQTVGYDNASVWIDTVDGATGTLSYVNGIADNASKTLPEAKLIASQVNLSRFTFANDSIAAAPAGFLKGAEIYGKGYVLDMNGDDVDSCYIDGASLAGSGVNPTTAFVTMTQCAIADATSFGRVIMDTCGFMGTTTFVNEGLHSITNCFSLIGGSSNPTFDLSGLAGVMNVNIRNWAGGLTLINVGAQTKVTIGGILGTVTITGVAGGEVEIRGIYKELVRTGFAGTVGTKGAILGASASNTKDMLMATTISNYIDPLTVEIASGSSSNEAYKECLVIFEKASDATQRGFSIVDSYDGSGPFTLNLYKAIPNMSLANGDIVTIIAAKELKNAVVNEAVILAEVIGTPTLNTISITNIDSEDEADYTTTDILKNKVLHIISGDNRGEPVKVEAQAVQSGSGPTATIELTTSDIEAFGNINAGDKVILT